MMTLFDISSWGSPWIFEGTMPQVRGIEGGKLEVGGWLCELPHRSSWQGKWVFSGKTWKVQVIFEM